jgi:hypothetical protein
LHPPPQLQKESHQTPHHHKLIILRNFNKIHVKIVKQYVHAKLMGFKL